MPRIRMMRPLTTLVLLTAALLAAAPTASADHDKVCFDTNEILCIDTHPEPEPQPLFCFASVDYCFDATDPDPKGAVYATIAFVKEQLGPCTCPPPPT